MDEDRRQHLQFIQDVITRMNSNSFSIKEWMMAINSAMLALFAGGDETKPIFLLLAAFPTFLFWLYDTYYLYMERQYRSLFNKVKNSSSKVQLYDLDASKEPICYFKTLFRPTEAGVYLPIIATFIISYLFLIN